MLAFKSDVSSLTRLWRERDGKLFSGAQVPTFCVLSGNPPLALLLAEESGVEGWNWAERVRPKPYAFCDHFDHVEKFRAREHPPKLSLGGGEWLKVQSTLSLKHSAATTMTPQVDRPNKRARVVAGSEIKSTKPRSTARLFAPFRALGFISNDVPFALQVRSAKGALKGPNVNIVSCLGRSWAMWDAGKMNLLFVGELRFSI